MTKQKRAQAPIPRAFMIGYVLLLPFIFWGMFLATGAMVSIAPILGEDIGMTMLLCSVVWIFSNWLMVWGIFKLYNLYTDRRAQRNLQQ